MKKGAHFCLKECIREPKPTKKGIRVLLGILEPENESGLTATVGSVLVGRFLCYQGRAGRGFEGSAFRGFHGLQEYGYEA